MLLSYRGEQHNTKHQYEHLTVLFVDSLSDCLFTQPFGLWYLLVTYTVAHLLLLSSPFGIYFHNSLKRALGPLFLCAQYNNVSVDECMTTNPKVRLVQRVRIEYSSAATLPVLHSGYCSGLSFPLTYTVHS